MTSEKKPSLLIELRVLPPGADELAVVTTTGGRMDTVISVEPSPPKDFDGVQLNVVTGCQPDNLVPMFEMLLQGVRAAAMAIELGDAEINFDDDDQGAQ